MDVCLGDSPAGAIAGPVILAPIINQADTVRRVPLTLRRWPAARIASWACSSLIPRCLATLCTITGNVS